MLKAVVFDLDNTLIDRQAAVAAWLAARVPATAVASLLRADAAGYGNRRVWLAAVARASHATAHATTIAFGRELPALMRLLPDALATIDRLLPRYRIAIATNGTAAMQRAKWRSVGLATRVPDLFVSGELGVAKPRAEFFAHVERALGCRGDELLMVGDHRRNDIAGARAVGWRTCWLDASDAQTPCDLRIARLAELSL